MNKIKTHLKQHNEKYIIALVILVIVIGFFLYLKPDNIVKVNSDVKVNYAGYLAGGELFDTNIKSIAVENGLIKDESILKPLEFKVGAGTVILGFEKGIIGMKEGETRKVIIPPEEGYIYNPSLVIQNLKRRIKLDRFSKFNVTEFTSKTGIIPMIGDELKRDQFPWSLKIINIENETVTIENFLKMGDKIVLPGAGWESLVEEVTDKEIVINQTPKVGDKTVIPTQDQGPKIGIVNKVTENSYDLDMNNPLSGQTLIFDITVISTN